MFIKLPVIKVIIRPKYLIYFLIWAMNNRDIKNNNALRFFISIIRRPSLMFEKEMDKIPIFKLCHNHQFSFSWIRYDSDGTRLQAFNVNDKKLLKTVKSKANIQSFINEIKLRQDHKDISPQIFVNSLDSIFYIEEWVDGRTGHASIEELYQALSMLKKYLYKIEFISNDEYLSNLDILNYGKKTEKFIKLIKKIGWKSLPISMIHGDLVRQNIVQLSNSSEIILIDWEYCRKDIVTYDVWLYLFDLYRTKHESILDNNFFLNLEICINRLGIKVNNVMALHELHMLQRHIFLKSVKIH